MITLHLDELNPEQLAVLYKAMIQIAKYEYADRVYKAGVNLCGAHDFCMEVARVK